jgi:hypothetical protein
MVNDALTQRNQLKQFVISYFTLLNAAITEQDNLLRVELLPDQLAELEGRSWPPSNLWLNLPEEGITVLYLTCDAEGVTRHEQVELVAPGSHRLEQMIASVRRHGKLAFLRLAPSSAVSDENQPHRPYMLFVVRIALEGQRKHEQLYAVCIDMVSGCSCPQLTQLIKQNHLLDKTAPKVLPRQVDFPTAWHTACLEVQRHLQRQDDGWARESLLALAQERRLVDQFYSEQMQATPALRAEWQERVAEVERRARPHALARTVQCALVLVPESIANSLG